MEPTAGRSKLGVRYSIDENHKIFEMELSGWSIDENLWPKKRTFKIFREWFEIELHSMVFDSGDDEIEIADDEF